ncbi:MAG: hypothetical protein HQK65_15285 [Desulfamplus sp.]|nr:hypothetical protein [Desulfamplus sp.]
MIAQGRYLFRGGARVYVVGFEGSQEDWQGLCFFFSCTGHDSRNTSTILKRDLQAQGWPTRLGCAFLGLAKKSKKIRI